MAPVGKEKLEVTFKYDLNGMLEVSAEILSTGKKETRVMSTTGLSKNQILSLAKDTFIEAEYDEENSNEEILNQEDNDWKKLPLYESVNVAVSLAEMKLGTLNESAKRTVENLLMEMKDAILKNDKALVEKLDEKLTDLLFDL